MSYLNVFQEHPASKSDAVFEGPQEVLVAELNHIDTVQGKARILAHVLDVAVGLALKTNEANNTLKLSHLAAYFTFEGISVPLLGLAILNRMTSSLVGLEVNIRQPGLVL